MADTSLKMPLIEGFFAVLRDGGTDRLDMLVTEDCADGDPLPFQLPGRAGVAQKVRLFRAAHPDARIVIESVERTASGARATWTTTARGLGGAAGEATWRFTGVFEIDLLAGKIRASRLEQSGAV